MTQDIPQNWQDIIWREWRNCEDEEYARYLFELVVDEPASWRATPISILLGAILGVMGVPLLIFLLFPANPNIGLIGCEIVLGMVIGGIGGLVVSLRSNLSQRLSWGMWLKGFIPDKSFTKGRGHTILDTFFFGFIVAAFSGLLGGIISALFFNQPALQLYFMLIGLVSLFINGIFFGRGAGLVIMLIGGLLGLNFWLLGSSSFDGDMGPVTFKVAGVMVGLGTGVLLGRRAGLIGVLICCVLAILIIVAIGSNVVFLGWLVGMLIGGVVASVSRMFLSRDKLNFAEVYAHRAAYIWWIGRPFAAEVEVALREHASGEVWLESFRRLDAERVQPESSEQLISSLESKSWLERFVARHTLIALGGEAIPNLTSIAGDKSHLLRQIARWLVRSVGYETRTRLAKQADRLLCPDCLTGCGPRLIRQSGLHVIYYGCRTCGQSREFIPRAQQIVAVLDDAWAETQSQQNDVLRVNWLTRRILFDFDQIEIVQATDKDVEHFVVQIGNDLDPFREPRYRQMRCIVGRQCQLSENTLRVLESVFGQVERGGKKSENGTIQADGNHRSQNWQEIIWREWRNCHDEAYRQCLTKLASEVSLSWEARGAGRPLAMEVEAALRQACQASLLAEVIWAEPLRLLAERQQQPDSPDKLIADLQSDDWVTRFTARHTLAVLGGEAVAQLGAIATDRSSPLRKIAAWLLWSIEAETTTRLFRHTDRLLCPHCLVHCHAHWIDLAGLLPFVYYGCRACGQSREFLDWTGKIVTVLDEGMTAAYIEKDGVIRGNWLLHRSLFDCDWVEIIQATDEEVERFAVHVGNDTDELRASCYEQMQCIIGPDCQLSENTLRVLQHTFGEVLFGERSR